MVISTKHQQELRSIKTENQLWVLKYLIEMGVLSINCNDTLVNQYTVGSLRAANAYVQENNFPFIYDFTYSTFNDAGIENTIKLRKNEASI